MAERVQLSEIPLPDAMPMPAMIPLPDGLDLMHDAPLQGILKKTSIYNSVAPPGPPPGPPPGAPRMIPCNLKPVGPPPGIPPELSDSEDEASNDKGWT